MSANAPTSAPTSAPASAPAPSSSGGASTPASTSSTPSSPTPYGGVPRSAMDKIFAELDSAGGDVSEAPEAAAAPPPIAKVPSSEPPPPDPAQVAEQAAPGEEQLNQSVRDALKAIPDPRLRKQLADGQFILRDLSKAGLPLPAVRQFIQDAPKYLEIAPTVETLQSMAETSRLANGLGSDFMTGTPEGYQNFAGALVQANPESFVGLVDFVLGNSTEIVKALQTNLGTEIASQYRGAIDRFCDGIFANVATAMRAKAEEGGDSEVLGEVAEELEKFLGLDKAKAQAQAGPARPDPRDQRIAALEAEKAQQVQQARERFASGVYNTAGQHLDQQIASFVNSKGNLTTNQRTALDKQIGDRLYEILLTNEAIQQKHQAIERSGRWDKAHFDQLTQLYKTAGERLLPQVAANVYREFWSLVGPEVSNRQAKITAQVQRRDVGASGAPTAPRPAAPQLPSGVRGEKAWKHLFAGIDAAAEQG